VLFKSLDEAGFCVARRRLGKVLFAVELVDGQHIALGQRRQFSAFFFRRVVDVFHIHADEARKHQHLAVGAKHVVSPPRRISTLTVSKRGRSHLARQRALPDHFVEARLIGRSSVAQAVRGCAGSRSGGSLHATPGRSWFCSYRWAASAADILAKNYP